MQSLDQAEGCFTNLLNVNALFPFRCCPILPVSRAKCLWEKERQGEWSEAQERGQWGPHRGLRSLLMTFFAWTIGWMECAAWKKGGHS